MKMKHVTTILISIGLLGCNEQTKTTDPKTTATEIPGQTTSLTQTDIIELDSVNINFQFRGNCYAYSSKKNAQESKGESHSDNLPKMIDKSFPRSGFYLVINQNELSKIDSAVLGCKLYLVNTSDSLINLKASDSRLYIVAEALNEKNEWIPISYLLSSVCGNSNHTVKLDKDEYWSFDIPVFKGTIKTKLRYTLAIDKEKKISSNEIVAFINEGQLDSENKQPHRSRNLMDPFAK